MDERKLFNLIAMEATTKEWVILNTFKKKKKRVKLA